MERARILVVDDRENVLKLLVRILGEAYEVTAVADGREAIALIRDRDFDLVVTDLRMPGADGLEVLRAAKQRDLEIILMTAHATAESAAMATAGGACGWLLKPFDPDDASRAVARALERRAAARAGRGLGRPRDGVEP